VEREVKDDMCQFLLLIYSVLIKKSYSLLHVPPFSMNKKDEKSYEILTVINHWTLYLFSAAKEILWIHDLFTRSLSFFIINILLDEIFNRR